jgi:hypothetical protein
LKLIHKTLEALLTHGPEFEALLMSRADVQKEEKWAWLWDPRSTGGVWYRWRLWDILTGSHKGSGYGRSQHKRMPQHVFDGGATWLVPEKGLRFEYTTGLDEFVSDTSTILQKTKTPVMMAVDSIISTVEEPHRRMHLKSARMAMAKLTSIRYRRLN